MLKGKPTTLGAMRPGWFGTAREEGMNKTTSGNLLKFRSYKLALFSLLALAAIIYPKPARADVFIRHVLLSVSNCSIKAAIENGLSRRLRD